MEIAVYNFDGEKVVSSFDSLINPKVEIPPYIQKLTNINNEMVADAPTFEEVADVIADLTSGNVFVAHNVNFDYSILKSEFKNLGKRFTRKKICTVELSKLIIPGMESYSLNSLTKDLGITMKSHHRAGDDARATVEVLAHLIENDSSGILEKRLKKGFDHYNLPNSLTPEAIKKIPEDTGVYYFKGSDGKMVYVGSTNDLRERVLNHFLPIEGSKKRIRLQKSVDIVEYEETGSELLARLKEAEAILTKKPSLNRPNYNSKLKFGVFLNEDKRGYKTVRVRAIKPGERVLTAYRNSEQAETAIYKRMEQYGLCAKLCGKSKGTGPCRLFKVKRCKGACIGRESKASYNRKVNRAFKYFKLPHEKFLIVGEGRNVSEYSGVLVHGDIVKGYAYFKKTNEDYQKVIGRLVDLPEHYLFKNIILYRSKSYGMRSPSTYIVLLLRLLGIRYKVAVVERSL